ncbi:MAG TPA: hypothetical protein VMT05_05975 [Terriglobales bacterium]|jgi:hypothetical protein|nr:hypothetical protein [Terriglobales bacterium]
MRSTVLIVATMLAVSALAQNPPAQLPGQKSVQEMVSEDPGVKKARRLLDQMIQALGGQAFLNVQDMEQQGRAYGFYHGNPSGQGSVFWRFWRWPDKERIELTKQRDVIYIYNGDQGWEITYKGTRAEDPEELKEYLRVREYSLNNVLRGWLQQPGTALFYEGIGLTQDKQVEKVTIINSRDQAVTIAIDQITHLPVKKSYFMRDPASREKDEEAEVYDNWRLVQGIYTAHIIVAMHNGEVTRQRFLQSVTYNQGLPESKFTASVTYVPKKK